MSAFPFPTVPMDRLDDHPGPAIDWLWHGYLARGCVSLLTSPARIGKTTLLAGLLRAIGTGGDFLGRPCAAAKALVVSEESQAMWEARTEKMPIGPHARLAARPFVVRPTAELWDELIESAVREREAGELDLLVIDTLANFLPCASENDSVSMLTALRPLHRFTAAGGAALLLHHPRRRPAAEGESARGSGALLGFADVIMELHRFGSLSADDRRRRLTARSRMAETPAGLVFEWDPATGGFRLLDDPHGENFRDNWPTLRAILGKSPTPWTHASILMDWPAEQGPPSERGLYRLLNQATDEGEVVREGTGRRSDPYRYRLATESDRVMEKLLRSMGQR